MRRYTTGYITPEAVKSGNGYLDEEDTKRLKEYLGLIDLLKDYTARKKLREIVEDATEQAFYIPTGTTMSSAR